MAVAVTKTLDMGVAAVVTCAMQADHPLKTYRENHSLSRADLARELDVSKTTITRWEEGKRKVDQEKLPHVSSKTGIPVKELRPDLAELMGVA